MDAQSLYASLKDAYETGTAADIAIEVIKSELMPELMTMKLDDRWKQPYEVFLDAWDHKVLDLENMLDESVSAPEKRNWLTSAVRLNNDLYTAVSNAQVVEHTLAGLNKGMEHKLSYDQFYNMVRSRCIILDANRDKSRPVMRVNNQEQTKSASRNNEHKASWFLPREQWQSMSQEERDAHISKHKKTNRKASRKGNLEKLT